MKRIAVSIAALATLLTAAQARAQLTPRNEGFMLGAHTVVATGVTISGPGMRGQVKTERGEGVGLQIGYGFSPRMMVYGNADLAKQATSFAIDGEMGLVHVELGGRLTFPRPGQRLFPYVTAMVGKRGLAASSTGGGINAQIQITGLEVGAGGGFLYALSPVLSLDAALLGARGKLSRVVLSGDVRSDDVVQVDNSNTIRLKVGVNWHP